VAGALHFSRVFHENQTVRKDNPESPNFFQSPEISGSMFFTFGVPSFDRSLSTSLDEKEINGLTSSICPVNHSLILKDHPNSPFFFLNSNPNAP
jgi:hypothetical protein